MNANTPKPDDQNQDAAPKTREQELDEAVNRVLRKYGSDLTAFTRDVQRDMVKVQKGTGSHAVEPNTEDR